MQALHPGQGGTPVGGDAGNTPETPVTTLVGEPGRREHGAMRYASGVTAISWPPVGHRREAVGDRDAAFASSASL